jgi:hypothetical protein
MFSVKGGLLTKLIDDDSKTFEEIKANAVLMKNAPKMLELLKRSIKEIQHLKSEYKDTGHCGKYLFECEKLLEETLT